MKLSELKEIIDMLDPNCEVKVAPPQKENDKHPLVLLRILLFKI